MTVNFYGLSLTELSNLLTDTTKQFIAALKNDRPIEELQQLRDYLSAIRNEIRRIESLGTI